MERTLLTAVACVSLLFAAACEPAEKPAPGVESSGAATGGLEGAAAEVAGQADAVAARAVAKTGEAVAAARVSLEELAGVTKASFSMENIKKLAGSVDAESLKKIATRIGDEIRAQSDTIKKLQAELAELDVTRALESTRLESTLSEAKTFLAQLRDKLAVVVAQLRAKGIDVSAFTKLLEGSQ